MIFLFSPEIRDKILQYCTTIDLINLACCNKSFNDLTRYYRWQNICLSWYMILKLTEEVVKNLHFVSSLRIYKVDYTKEGSEECVHYTDTRFIHWEDACHNFNRILESVDSMKLKKLSIEGVITDAALEKILNEFTNLCDLELISTYYISKIGWKSLESLTKLNRLTLQHFRAVNSEMKIITESENLIRSIKELHLIKCFTITDDCLQYISNLSSLRELSITGNGCITMVSPDLFKKLTNLVYLNLENTSVNNQTLVHLSTHLKGLLRLNLSCCPLITDKGISILSKMDNLEMLWVDFCDLTDFAFQHVKGKNLKHLVFGGRQITDHAFSFLKELPSLRELLIYNINNVITKECLDKFCSVTGMVRDEDYLNFTYSFVKLVKP